VGEAPIIHAMVQSDWSIPRRSFHRRFFVAAGIYNLVWGAFSVFDPQWFFRVSDMAAANHPQIFATLGMVIGLYGILYLEVARVPERGWMIAAVGLAGKVLGPIGLIYLTLVGVWPAKTLVIAVTNDFIWWPFFTLYLVDAWPAFRGDLARR
jgi:hypothetical protein